MNKNVTATIKRTVATVAAFDGENIVNFDCIIDKAKGERDAIKASEQKGFIFCDILKTTDTALLTYSVESEWFIANAVKMDKRPIGNYISRTVAVNKLTVLVYDRYTKTAQQLTYYVDTKNNEKALKAVEKQCKGTDKKPLKILNSEITNVLYVMTVEKFIENAVIIDK